MVVAMVQHLIPHNMIMSLKTSRNLTLNLVKLQMLLLGEQATHLMVSTPLQKMEKVKKSLMQMVLLLRTEISLAGWKPVVFGKMQTPE